MSLFIATLAFHGTRVLDSAKVGILVASEVFVAVQSTRGTKIWFQWFPSKPLDWVLAHARIASADD